MRLPNRWISQLGILTTWLAGGLLLGAWFGGVSWWLVGALGLYVAHVLRQVYLLDRVLEGEKRLPSFETRGLWAEMFARVDKMRAKARSRKKKYHRLLREVWESTGVLRDAGIILNAAHEILWFNPAATRLLGLDPSRDIGNRIDNLVRHPVFVRHLSDPKGEDVTIPAPHRPDRWLTITLIPYGQNQRLAIVRDVTRQVKLETMRRDFVANASHELRSPLTVISGYLDSLAEDDDLPESWQQPVAEMQRQADRMTHILKDLIELTRLESAEPAARHDVVDVGALLEQIVGEFRPRAEGRTIELHLETDAALLGKEVEVYSIAYNLIHNAVRFTPKGGRIDVSWRAAGGDGDVGAGDGADHGAEPDGGVEVGQGAEAGRGAEAGHGAAADGRAEAGGRAGAEGRAAEVGGRAEVDRRDEADRRAETAGVVLEVADSGIGIPRDQISRVTERFYRVDPGRSRATGGTGLGLAIVKHALQRHGGTLEIESREGEGSTFTCRFPAARVARRGGETVRKVSARAFG